MEKKSQKDKLKFEDALRELEKIAMELEDGEMGLEESIKRFEKGMALAKFCHEKLEEAEQKIEILQKGGDGKAEKKPVKARVETGEIEDDGDMQGSLL